MVHVTCMFASQHAGDMMWHKNGRVHSTLRRCQRSVCPLSPAQAIDRLPAVITWVKVDITWAVQQLLTFTFSHTALPGPNMFKAPLHVWKQLNPANHTNKMLLLTCISPVSFCVCREHHRSSPVTYEELWIRGRTGRVRWCWLFCGSYRVLFLCSLFKATDAAVQEGCSPPGDGHFPAAPSSCCMTGGVYIPV